MDLAKESLEIKRKAVDNFIEKGLYPYSKHYLNSVKRCVDLTLEITFPRLDLSE